MPPWLRPVWKSRGWVATTRSRGSTARDTIHGGDGDDPGTGGGGVDVFHDGARSCQRRTKTHHAPERKCTTWLALAGAVGPSHGFVRIREIGTPVQVFCMTVCEGDLVHADRHGAVTIPADLLEYIVMAIDCLVSSEAIILDPVKEGSVDFDEFEVLWVRFEKARTRKVSMQTQARSPTYTSAVLSGAFCGMLCVGWDEVLTRAGIVATERKD